MLNVETKVEGNMLTITVDISKEYGYSKSGKSIIIASTQGNSQVAKGTFLGLNLYKYPGGDK